MNICIITPDYPDDRVSKYPFVEQLAIEMARQGHQVCVVAPYWINRRKRFYHYQEEHQYDDGNLTILRPNFFTLSSIRIGKVRISEWLKHQAINRSLNRLPFKPDVIYGHFWESAWAGYKYASRHHIPLFVACGESNLSKMFPLAPCHDGMIDYVRGVVCVSTKAKDDVVKLGFATEEKCKVFPNAIDSTLFFKRDKEQCRERLGLPSDKFIVAFVGWFNERKGSKRLCEAIDLIEDEVYSLFIGKNDDSIDCEPKCKGILFMGSVPHNQVPDYLCSADVFVLPTLNEGCSNAVVEAMACGLPVISSNLSFNWDVLDETNSILVNPSNVEEIKDAIVRLKRNKVLRHQLTEGALEKSKSLKIDQRVNGIVEFIREKVDKTNK